MSAARFRLEIFVSDMALSRHFYEVVLGFKSEPGAHHDYVPLTLGEARLALNLMSNLPVDHPIRAQAVERRGIGLELVFDNTNIEALADRATSAGWSLSSGISAQPWGASDFRIQDPDGYYLRFST